MRRTLISWLLHLGLITKNRRAKRKFRSSIAEELESRVMLHCEVFAENVTVQEAEAPIGAVVNVTISEPQASTVLVAYRTQAVHAQPGADYEHVAGTLTFSASVTSLPITVPILADSLNEADERFQLQLECPSAEHSTHAHLTIRDDDPLPTISLGDAPPVIEGQSATSDALFSLSLSEPSGRPVTVSYAAVSDTATAGEDFQQARGAVVFEPGETLKQVMVSVNGDVRQEPEETFFLEITSADYAVVGDEQGTGTILAEDRQYLVTGAGAGGGPHVRVFDPLTGEERFGFYAYDESFTGGVRTAAADVNADGKPDIITAAGPGGGPLLRVFDGQTGEQLDGDIGSFFAYDSSFTGGVFVAAGDLNGDGWADVITGADAGGGPHVRAFSGFDGSELASFIAVGMALSGHPPRGSVRADFPHTALTADVDGQNVHWDTGAGSSASVANDRSAWRTSPRSSGGHVGCGVAARGAT